MPFPFCFSASGVVLGTQVLCHHSPRKKTGSGEGGSEFTCHHTNLPLVNLSWRISQVKASANSLYSVSCNKLQ